MNEHEHEWIEQEEEKKWGIRRWRECTICHKTEDAGSLDVTANWQAYQKAVTRTTNQAGHKPGAKIEYGEPTMLGRDYDPPASR